MNNKIIHFSFLLIASLIIARLVSVSNLIFSWIWVGFAIVAFATVYFPFTKNAFEFYKLPLDVKLGKYVKKVFILDLIISVIGGIPFVICWISGNSECYLALLSIAIWYALGFLVLLQLITLFIITILDILERLPANIRYIIFLILIVVGLLLNINAQILPNTRANFDKNSFFEHNNQCDKLNIYDIPESDIGWTGCGDFKKFEPSGQPIKKYAQVVPINAFRQCYYLEKLGDWENAGYAMHTVDCRTMGQRTEEILINTNMIPKKYMEQYGFDQDDSYFEVCKVILTDYIEEKRKECRS